MKKTKNISKKVLTFFFLVGMVVCFSDNVFAAFSTPTEDMWITNGSTAIIRAIVADPINPNLVYVGGGFTHLGPNTGTGARIATSTGQVITSPSLAAVRPNGAINAVVSDGVGGFYIGGAFTAIGTTTRNRIAHILPNGSLDTSFDPNANAIVMTLALYGTTLYVGGDITTIGGQTRNRLAALDTATGLATSFSSDKSATVRALVVSSDGSKLYVGGDFSNGSGRLAQLDTATGADINFIGADASVRTLALSPNGLTLYAGGDFTSLGASFDSRARIGAIDTTTGAATSFNPIVDAPVSSLLLSGSTLYVGGTFTFIGGQTRNSIAAVNATTGFATSFNPDISASLITIPNVKTLALSGTTLYVGGDFTIIGGLTKWALAAVDTTTGTVSSFASHANNIVNAVALSADAATLYAGGAFTAIGGAPRNRLAAINTTTGAATSFDPNVGGTVSGLTISPDGATLYVGGSFTSMGVDTRNNLAAVDTTTALATSFDPATNGTVNALLLSGTSTLYAGGSFTTISGQTRNRIAALNTTTGVATSFDPNANTGTVNALALSGTSTLYAGGSFTSIGGQTRNRIAALDTGTGLATSFNPNAGNIISALVLSPDNSTLYAGGAFTTIGGGVRNRLAALNTTTGLVTSFASNAGSTVNALALSSNGLTLYVGGAFTTIPSITTRNRLAAVNTTTYVVTPFDPNMGNTVFALALSSNGSKLYSGGSFSTVGGVARQSLASFSPVPGITVNRTSGLVTSESGTTATTSIVLDTQPTANVIIGININNSEVTVSSSSLTFTTSNWNIPQIVTITGINDGIIDGNTVHTITTNAATSADTDYNTLNAADITATNTDVNFIGITVSPTSDLVTTEAGGTATSSIVLNSQPSDDVVIPLSSSNTAEGTVSTSSIIFTPSTWNTPQIITITGVNDTTIDGNITYTIVTGSSTSLDLAYNNINPANISVTNADDDVAPVVVSSGGGGTYRLGGCTDSLATNFERYATYQVGVCTYASSTLAQLEAQQVVTSTVPPVKNTASATSSFFQLGIPLFSRSLRLGNIGNDVRYLQMFLNASLDTQIASSGTGAPGKETRLFGGLTKAAVIRFQEKYADQILKPSGLVKGTGFVGEATKRKINEMIGK